MTKEQIISGLPFICDTLTGIYSYDDHSKSVFELLDDHQDRWLCAADFGVLCSGVSMWLSSPINRFVYFHKMKVSEWV